MIKEDLNKILKELKEDNINVLYITNILNRIYLNNEYLDDNDIKIIEKIYEIINNENILLLKINKIEDIDILKEQLKHTLNKKVNKDYILMKLYFIINNVELSNNYPEKLFMNLNMSFESLDKIKDENVVGILLKFTSSIDNAFSIQKIAGMYILNYYLPDVPTYLNNNKDIAKYAYDRANTINVRIDNHNSHKIEMLPPFLSKKYLSLNKGFMKNAIVFNFVFGENGELYSTTVSRKNVLIKDTITAEKARGMVYNNRDQGITSDDIKIYKELYELLNKDFIFNDPKDFQKLLLFGGKLINKYVAKNTSFYIGRHSTKYVLPEESTFATANMPLKNIASNISLAFFLDENGIKKFDTSDLNYIKENREKIIEHLNKQHKILKFVNNNPEFARKFVQNKEYGD